MEGEAVVTGVADAERYLEFKVWQDKILDIGKKLQERGEFVDARKRKLQEEHTEICTYIDEYFDTHPDRWEGDDGILRESMDFINVGGIVLSLIDEPLPLGLMTLRLLENHGRYASKPGIVFTVGADYSQEQLFYFWEAELDHINQINSGRIRDGVLDFPTKVESALRNFRKDLVTEVDRSLQLLPKSYKAYQEQKGEAESGKRMDAGFYLRRALGDSINDNLIILGLFGFRIPYKDMLAKLNYRDERYNT
jgi:hypothetical protein